MLGICFSEELVITSSFAFFLYFFLHFFLGYLLKGKKKKQQRAKQTKNPNKNKNPKPPPPKKPKPWNKQKTPNQQQTPKNPKPSYSKHQPVKFCANIKRRVAPYAEVLQSVYVKTTTTGCVWGAHWRARKMWDRLGLFGSWQQCQILFPEHALFSRHMAKMELLFPTLWRTGPEQHASVRGSRVCFKQAMLCLFQKVEAFWWRTRGWLSLWCRQAEHSHRCPLLLTKKKEDLHNTHTD